MKSNKIKPSDKSYCIWYDDLGKAHFGQYIEMYDVFTDDYNDSVLTPREDVSGWKYQ